MHWRKAPTGSDGRVFYIVASALTASVAATTILLIWRSRLKRAATTAAPYCCVSTRGTALGHRAKPSTT
jgi:hypothetical protein